MAAWRLNEVREFMDKYETDILVVKRVNWYNDVTYTFDWNELRESFHLNKYDLLIFDPAYNMYNEYNANRSDSKPLCNGLSFNGELPASYMLRLRKYSNQPVEISSSVYKAAHHIFLNSYLEFSNSFPEYPQNAQSIHLYPGGGFYAETGEQQPYNIHPDVLLFPSQAFIVDFVNQYLPHNAMLPAYGGPMISVDDRPVVKTMRAKDQPLMICFTSLGSVQEKGADTYVIIAELYKTTFPNDNTVFFGVGIVPRSLAVTHLELMPQKSLENFYRNHVDVIFNLERTDRRHGWPLGTEAITRGAILFTTDQHNMNARNNYHFDDGMYIVHENALKDTVRRLHDYYVDRKMLHQHSVAIQRKSRRLFKADVQMAPIFGAIDNRIVQHL